MTSRSISQRKVPWVAVAVLLVAVAGCGSGSSNASSPHHSPVSAVQAIKQNWTAFFSAKTAVNRRIALLQDGSRFSTFIKSESRSQLAASVSSKVSAVKVQSGNEATVTYSILIGGKPELSNKKGVAVKQGGVWKVGTASFCGLLVLENGGKTSGLPAACSAAK